jgi:hypothetical protein
MVDSSDNENEPFGLKFVCSLFNNAVSSSDYVMSNDRTFNE